MSGPNRNPWLPFQVEMLERLAASGLPYREIASRVGHSKTACSTKMSEARVRRRKDNGETPPKRDRSAKKPYVRPPAPPALPPSPPSARSCRTSTLLADAELRARIAVLGVTSGLLGDPLPGRSALDQKRAGLTEQAPSYDRRFADNRLKVTLATEPLR